VRYYFALNRVQIRVCPTLPIPEIVEGGWPSCYVCDKRKPDQYSWQCIHDKELVSAEAWQPFCSNGKVVSLYTTVGKARTQCRKNPDGAYSGRVYFFDMPADTFWLDDPAPLSQRLEARMVDVIQRKELEEKNEAAALVPRPRKPRKK
jgi:hypothetical protein